MKHQTKLNEHFKEKKFWLDLIILLIFWIFFILINNISQLKNIPYLFVVIKITTLLASIEFLGFIALHLLGHKKGLMLQGLVGGFISSTMIYLQLQDKKELADYSPKHLVIAMLLSNLSMLILCLVIIYSLAGVNKHQLMVPVTLQIGSLLVIILTFSFKKSEPSHKILESNIIDDPIIWKKVFSFALILVSLMLAMKLIVQVIPQSRLITTFLVSLFESHAILAANLVDETLKNRPQEIEKILLLILLGNILSKITLTLRISHLKIKSMIAFSLITSFIPSIIYVLYK